jgi:hypothetical protein
MEGLGCVCVCVCMHARACVNRSRRVLDGEGHMKMIVVMHQINTPRESGFGGLEVACWPLVPKFAGSHPA